MEIWKPGCMVVHQSHCYAKGSERLPPWWPVKWAWNRLVGSFYEVSYHMLWWSGWLSAPHPLRLFIYTMLINEWMVSVKFCPQKKIYWIKHAERRCGKRALYVALPLNHPSQWSNCRPVSGQVTASAEQTALDFHTAFASSTLLSGTFLLRKAAKCVHLRYN